LSVSFSFLSSLCSYHRPQAAVCLAQVFVVAIARGAQWSPSPLPLMTLTHRWQFSPITTWREAYNKRANNGRPKRSRRIEPADGGYLFSKHNCENNISAGRAPPPVRPAGHSLIFRLPLVKIPIRLAHATEARADVWPFQCSCAPPLLWFAQGY
jgi:hypothetical protein